MKKLMIACCLAGLVACSNTNEFDSELDAKTSKPAAPGQSVSSTSTSQPTPALNPLSAPVSTAQPVVTSQPVATPVPVTTTTVSTPPGMNPPHGQPGHRCDIEVGAPLNSAPKQTAKTTTATPVPQNITVTPTTTTATQVKTAPGMNPPHGQPGHRCDIEVGAPLNSAPKTTTTMTPVTPVKTEEAKPVTEPWKVDIKDKPAKKDSSNN